jgi:hypothetical protein
MTGDDEQQAEGRRVLTNEHAPPARTAHEATVERFAQYEHAGMVANLNGAQMTPPEALVQVITTGKPGVTYRMTVKAPRGPEIVVMVEVRLGGQVALTHPV